MSTEHEPTSAVETSTGHVEVKPERDDTFDQDEVILPEEIRLPPKETAVEDKPKPDASSANVIPADVAVDAEDASDYVIDKNSPNPNVNLTDPVIKAWPVGKSEFPPDRLAILMATAEEFRSRAKGWKNLEWGRDAQTEDWLRGMREGTGHFTESVALINVLAKEIGEFQQSIDAGGTKLAPGLARIGDHSEGETKLTGEMASVRLTKALNMGALVQVPLWHTGIWVTLKAPSEGALLVLERELVQDKITLGKETGGRTHSAQGVYAIARVVDFVLDHVYTATTAEITPEYLKSITSLNDLHALVLGILMATYPNGYPLSRVCIADPANCKHVTSEIVNVAKLLFVAKRSLSEKQLAHMRRRTSKFTKIELDAYQSEHKFSKLPSIKLNDAVTVELKIPTIADYELSGRTWVDDITKLIDRSLGANLDEEQRDKQISEMALAQAARQYGHWVKQINIDGNSVITDRAAVEETISMISGNEVFEAAFYEGVEKFITESTIALVAIPNYNCPACQKPQTTESAAHPHLITLDVVQTFFTLLARRLARITARRLD